MSNLTKKRQLLLLLLLLHTGTVASCWAMHSTPTRTAGTNGEPLSSPEAVALRTTQSLHRVGHRCTASSSSTTDTKSTPSSSSTTSPREQRACFSVYAIYTSHLWPAPSLPRVLHLLQARANSALYLSNTVFLPELFTSAPLDQQTTVLRALLPPPLLQQRWRRPPPTRFLSDRQTHGLTVCVFVALCT